MTVALQATKKTLLRYHRFQLPHWYSLESFNLDATLQPAQVLGDKTTKQNEAWKSS